MNRLTAWTLPLLLTGCGSSIQLDWDLQEGDELGQAVVLALFGVRYQQDERERVEGPHVAGSSVEIAVRHPNPNQVVEGWTLVSDDTTVASVSGVTADRNALFATVALGEVGDAKLSVRDDAGEPVDDLLVRVEVPVDASVEPYIDLRAGDGPPVGDDGTLRIIEDGAASLVVTWLAEDGEPMTGRGALSVDLPPEAVGKISAATVASFTLTNLDYFTLEAGEPTTTAVTLDAYAGPAVVASWDVEVLPVEAVDTVDLAIELEPGEAGDGSGEDRIGYLRPDVFATERRVLGVELRWYEDGAEIGTAAYAELVASSEQHTLRACVPDTLVCAEMVEYGRLGRLGDGVVDGLDTCGCAQGGVGAVGPASLLVLLGLRRRRVGLRPVV